MKTKYAVIGLGLILVVVIVYRIATYGANDVPPSIEQIQATEGVPVTVVEAKPDTLVRTIVLSGTLEGAEQADVTSRIMETVEKVFVRAGYSVKAGQVVARLSRTSAQAQIDQAEAAFDNANSDYERMKALFAEGAVSAQQLDGVRTQLAVAEANLRSATALVELTTPISGRVTDVFVEPGQVAMPGQPVVRVARLDRLVLKADAPEAEAVMLKIGQTARVAVGAYPDTAFVGKVGSVALSADPQSRQFRVEVDVANPSSYLRPGVYATATIEVARRNGVVAIPGTAVQSSDSRSVVYVVEDGIAVARAVTTGLAADRMVEVVSGVSAGERVIVLGATRVADGTKVKVTEAAS